MPSGGSVTVHNNEWKAKFKQVSHYNSIGKPILFKTGQFTQSFVNFLEGNALPRLAHSPFNSKNWLFQKPIGFLEKPIGF